jgi:hypothetical protein
MASKQAYKWHFAAVFLDRAKAALPAQIDISEVGGIEGEPPDILIDAEIAERHERNLEDQSDDKEQCVAQYCPFVLL